MNKLMRYLIICTIGIYTQINVSIIYAMETEKKEYDPLNRPIELQQIIDDKFDIISARAHSVWRMNGKERYCILNILDSELVKSMIFNSPDQKIFNILDMGGGLFQWGHKLAEFIDNDNILAERDFKVNIINTGGEQYPGQDVKYTTKCTIYNFGAFKLENLKESLNKKDMFIEQHEGFDLIVASWCLRHLTDPLGTMVQAYNLLKPERLMLFDGFGFSVASEDEKYVSDEGNCFMIKFLRDTQVEFLMQENNLMGSYNEFMIRKSTENIKFIPYYFEEIYDRGKDTVNRSRYFLKFNKMKDKPTPNEIKKINKECAEFYAYNRDKLVGTTVLFGDEKLFESICKSGIYEDCPIELYKEE